MVTAKKYLYVKKFDGTPKKENFQLAEEELRELNDGEFLAEAVYLSVDPYLRVYPSGVGDTMNGTQVAKIIQSRSSKFPVGKYVVGGLGWRTHTIWKGNIPMESFYTPHLLPFEATDVPLSLALGVLGMTGNTAYFGILETCQPKSGDTIVISGAGGAVGSHAGQIAKIKGCNVIGITGSDEKVEWLKSVGFDHVINYKTVDLKETLSNAASKGVDCFFDNVGGVIRSTVIDQMNEGGLIAVCGSISSYNDVDEPSLAPSIQSSMVAKRLKMENLMVNKWTDRWSEGILQNLEWFREGKLKYKETVTEGFENIPEAFIGLFKGDNIGKAVVKV